MAKKPPDVAQNDARNSFFNALTGRDSADIHGNEIHGMLMAAFGPSKRDSSRPNTTAAAKSLGVSQRTVQRWLASETQQHQKPRSSTLKNLTKRARQAATTKRGRERSIRQRRAQLTREGFRFSVNGVQGPAHGPGYARLRIVNFDLDDPDQAAAFLDAWVQGGDAGAQQYIVDHAAEIYHDSWVFEDIGNVGVTGPYGGHFRK